MSRPVELDSRNPLQHCCAALEVSRLPVAALSCLPLDPGGHRRFTSLHWRAARLASRIDGLHERCALFSVPSVAVCVFLEVPCLFPLFIITCIGGSGTRVVPPFFSALG